MFIDRAMNPRHALQRSAMFPAMVRETGLRFAPPEREGIFLGSRSINITSLRDEEPWVGKILLRRKQEVRPLLRRGRTEKGAWACKADIGTCDYFASLISCSSTSRK
jgi:hypothetical protein